MLEKEKSQKNMTTVSITVDQEMLQAVKSLSSKLGMTLSSFTIHALQLAMQQQYIRELEEKHRQGYLKHPVGEEEFSIWEDEQAWGD